MATVTVDLNTSYQTFIGWEAVAEIGSFEWNQSYVNWADEALAANIELGITRLRVQIISGMENTTQYAALFLDDTAEYSTTPPTTYTDWNNNRYVPINDDSDPDNEELKFDWRYLDQQIDTIVIPMKTLAEARGEEIFWTICYVHFSNTDQLHITTPAEYGEFILATWRHIYNTYGFVPDGHELFLEPNEDAAVSAAELAPMIAAARDRLVADGFTKPYMIAPSKSNMGGTDTYINDIKTANATAAGYIDEYSYHRYDTPPTQANLEALRTLAVADGKNTSMLEAGYGIGSIHKLYEDLVYARVVSWTQFALCWSNLAGNVWDSGNQYFVADVGPGYEVYIEDIVKYLRHYMKYIRPGAVMKGVTNSSGNQLGVVFQNPNGKVVVVVKSAASDAALTIAGLPAGTYEIRYTRGNGTGPPTTYDQAITSQTITAGQDVVFNMPGAGVVSIFDTNYMASSTNYTQNCGGSITITGTAKKAPAANKSGSVTAAGAMLKAAMLLKAGSSTPAGVIARLAAKISGGSVTPGGIAARLASKLTGGSITPSGAIQAVRAILISLAGAITASGAVRNAAAKTAGGSVAPSGLAVRLAAKLTGGSTTPSGAIQTLRAVLLNLAGSITASGSVRNAVVKILAGSVAAAGSAVKLISKPIGGSTTPSGAIQTLRAVLLSLAGSITPSGAVRNAAVKILAGSVTTAGSLSRAAAKVFSGAIAFAGSVLTEIFGFGPKADVAVFDFAVTTLVIGDAAATKLVIGDAQV